MRIGTFVGNDMSGIATTQGQFHADRVHGPSTLFSITGNAGGEIFLNITPVPEPATVLGLAAGALGVGGVIRRRRVGRFEKPAYLPSQLTHFSLPDSPRGPAAAPTLLKNFRSQLNLTFPVGPERVGRIVTSPHCNLPGLPTCVSPPNPLISLGTPYFARN